MVDRVYFCVEEDNIPSPSSNLKLICIHEGVSILR